MARLESVLNVISNFLMVIAGIAITLMMVHIGADIIAKTVFHQPIVATLEIVTWYYMVITIFPPVAYIQIHKKHLMVELFTRGMSRTNLAMLEGLTAILGFVYVGILFWLTLEVAIEQTASGEIQDATFFDLPVWPSRWVLPVSLGAMALILIVQAIRDLIYAITGRGEPTQQPAEGIVVEEA